MTDRPVYTLATLPELAGSAPLYGVIGYPIAHSRSPILQMAAFQALGLPARYVRIEARPEELIETVRLLQHLGFRGWNCTIPHKVAMLELVLPQSSAQRAGTVNTVRHDLTTGALLGYSTDGPGWTQAIRASFQVELSSLRILLLGAGGSGQTLAREALFRGCRSLIIANRSLGKAEELVQSLRTQFGSGCPPVQAVPLEEPALAALLRQTDLLVNSTSVGLHPDDAPVLSAELLHPELMVYDLVYRATPTLLVSTARARGARAADGLSMLLYQGAEAFQIWTGQPAPLSAMAQALSQ